MKESESKQEAPYYENPNGLHGIDYPQRFVRAPRSDYPQKNSRIGMKCEPNKIMSQVMKAK